MSGTEGGDSVPAAAPVAGNNQVFGGDSAEAARELYDKWASKYDSDLQSWGWSSPRRVAEVLVKLGCGKSQHVLDVGCGTGLSGAALVAMGVGSEGGVVGIDISQASIDISKSKGIYKTVICGNLEETLPVESEAFDAIACAGVTSYIRKFDVFLAECIRILRPGGAFVMTHRYDLWDSDEHGCRSAVDALVERGDWSIEHIGEPEVHMPDNPDPVHSAKKIRLLGFRKCARSPEVAETDEGAAKKQRVD